MKIADAYLDADGRIKLMPRGAYNEFTKTLPEGACLFCDGVEYQIIIRAWRHWMLVEPISPYFKHHVMLCTKRHVRYFRDLNHAEQDEFWRADEETVGAYRAAGILRVRIQLHARFAVDTNGTREHLHIHYYEFTERDFEFLIPDDAHLQDMGALLTPYLR